MGLADLVAVGERNTPSHRLGVALSAVVTIDAASETVTLNVLPSSGNGSDHLQAVLDRIADFALLDADQLAEDAMDDRLSTIRAVAAIRDGAGRGTILVAHEAEDEKQVRAILSALFDNLDKLAVLLEATALPDPAKALEALDLALHPAAARFYREAETSNASTEPPTRSAAELEVMAEVLTEERDDLAGRLETLTTRQLSLAKQLSTAERSRDVAVTELEGLRRDASEYRAALDQLSSDVQTVRNERDRLRARANQLQQRIDTVSFASVEQASKRADDMRLRAEQAEALYEEAYQIGEACLQQGSGGSNQAREALLQIEQMEQRLHQVTRDHRQCIAELEASAD